MVYLNILEALPQLRNNNLLIPFHHIDLLIVISLCAYITCYKGRRKACL